MSTQIQASFNSTGVSDQGTIGAGVFSLSISGIFVGTVVLQRKYDEGWNNVSSHTAVTETNPTEGEGCKYRFKCTAYTSGQIDCRAGQ